MRINDLRRARHGLELREHRRAVWGRYRRLRCHALVRVFVPEEESPGLRKPGPAITEPDETLIRHSGSSTWLDELERHPYIFGQQKVRDLAIAAWEVRAELVLVGERFGIAGAREDF